ncbi:hypothetical protein [Bosea sp. Root483D1]|uniref:hypothetical protein n=1 Tax=Bosea sp. Root483D1 TaxID=1736544 RepID=UPI0012E3DEDB|nr:hypothetical protein [Bosea sp. Root483D1]
MPARQVRGEALALGVVLPGRQSCEPDAPAVGEERVAMPVETGQADQRGPVRRRTSVVCRPCHAGRGRHDNEER